jgi:hypothetical protein
MTLSPGIERDGLWHRAREPVEHEPAWRDPPAVFLQSEQDNIDHERVRDEVT